MKTPEQLKGAIRNIAASKNLRSQEVLQMFLFERILERLSVSRYRGNFILKGGLLISSMLGISERTTMDMDTTVRGLPMEKEQITSIVQNILSLDVNDGIQFRFQRIEPIREDDAYNNFRIHLDALYGKINSPMKIDITTGDEITPAAIFTRFCLSEKVFPLWHIRWSQFLPRSMKPSCAVILVLHGQEIFTIYIPCSVCAVTKYARRSCGKPSCILQKNVALLPNSKNGRIFYRI